MKYNKRDSNLHSKSSSLYVRCCSPGALGVGLRICWKRWTPNALFRSPSSSSSLCGTRTGVDDDLGWRGNIEFITTSKPKQYFYKIKSHLKRNVWWPTVTVRVCYYEVTNLSIANSVFKPSLEGVMIKSISYSNRTGHLLRLISKAAPLEGHIRDMTQR